MSNWLFGLGLFAPTVALVTFGALFDWWHRTHKEASDDG